MLEVLFLIMIIFTRFYSDDKRLGRIARLNADSTSFLASLYSTQHCLSADTIRYDKRFLDSDNVTVLFFLKCFFIIYLVVALLL